MYKRGIVIVPSIIGFEGGYSTRGPILSDKTLRKYTTYWDEIVMVDVIQRRTSPDERGGPYRMGGIGANRLPRDNDDVKFLLDNGVFRMKGYDASYKTKWHSGEIPKHYCRAQQKVFSDLNENEEGYWTIGQSVKNLKLPSSTSHVKNNIVTTLSEALPTPSEDIHVSEILEFKHKHSEKLNTFRKTFEELYEEVIKSPDRELKLTRAVERVEDALCEVRIAMEEQKMNPTYLSQKTLWEVPVEALKVFVATQAVGFPLELSALSSTTQAAISMNETAERKPNDLPGKVNDYAYLGHVEEELM